MTVIGAPASSVAGSHATDFRVAVLGGERDTAAVRAAMLLRDHPTLAVVADPRGAVVTISELVRLEPDVVLLGLGPGRAQLVARLVEGVADRDNEPVRVLALSAGAPDAEVRTVLKAGAVGFLRTDARPSTLVELVTEAAAGGVPTTPAGRTALVHVLAAPAEPGPLLGGQLTRREQDVLRLVARGLSNAEVAAALVVTTSTVKTHMNAILSKLELRDRVQATVFAYEHGLVRPGVN